ncbi:hypothetical protein [Streptomyces sp. NBC_01506]|uniref:hypothetical protein n=1 Tax=Streptomyces sp. NBC_01506 TaxID=2903887 RepID=UPI00386A99D4
MGVISELVRAELDRHDWDALRCGCGGTAGHVPTMFEAIIEAGTPGDMVGHTLDNHLEVGTNLFEVSVPAVGVLLAALAGDLSPLARAEFMITLWRLASGESHSTEVAAGRAGLGDECRAGCREGLWVVGRTGLTGSADEAEMAADIVEFIDLDEERSAYYQPLLRDRTRTKTKRRRAV